VQTAAELKAMPFENLKALFRETSGQVIADKKEIFPLLRQQLPVYAITN
jgi:hypothetical protein